MIKDDRDHQAKDSNSRGGEKPYLTLLDAYSALSSRECQILNRLKVGKTNYEIARELYISPKTVENHITRIGKKLGVHGRGSLRQWIRTKRIPPQNTRGNGTL